MLKILRILSLAILLFSPLLMAGQAVGDLTVEGAYARAVPPGLPNSAAFMTINNSGTSDRQLVSAESSAADVVELHTHINDNGVMRMRRVQAIDVPANSAAVLQPGGLHVMLIGLRQPISPGDEVDLSLIFDDGSKTSMRIPVQKIKVPMAMPKCGKGKCGGGKCGAN